MKKFLYSLIGIIPLAIGAYFLFQNLSGNSDAMLTYLEETNEYTTNYNELIEQEVTLGEEGTPEEIVSYTEETLIPELEKILKEYKAYGEKIEKDELKKVHELDIQSMEKYIAAETEWLAGNDDKATALFEESDQLLVDFEDELNSLASKWGVEIEWEK
ncbi:hypothetical protein [Aquibacillus kalidii]|uniref:hypothetical protein n=1 Tax=Aquibacillus kalidii TaxID=2762597 RepID=UPI001644A92E|nr:hypothetical protein [Aquibacillus kalidii]